MWKIVDDVYKRIPYNVFSIKPTNDINSKFNNKGFLSASFILLSSSYFSLDCIKLHLQRQESECSYSENKEMHKKITEMTVTYQTHGKQLCQRQDWKHTI
eukprot:GHVO01048922.1.p1 GENE.GHVO01048922.1~~GHVO01048922.1.p1  ORF type:complete len:100 (+),score=7.84 GHVO01048922.1:716-1015(+)